MKRIVRIGCRDRGPSWRGNDHDIVLVREDDYAFYGYPAERAEEWEKNGWEQIASPKFAWVILQDGQDTKGGSPCSTR